MIDEPRQARKGAAVSHLIHVLAEIGMELTILIKWEEAWSNASARPNKLWHTKFYH